MSGVIDTGVEAINELLTGALPEGHIILVYGPPGCGLELFAKQYANAGGDNVTYIATDEDTDNIIATMQQFGWNKRINVVNFGKEYYQKVLAKRLEVSKYREEGIKMEDIKHFTSASWRSEKPINFLTKLIYETSRLPPGFRLVVDSLNFFLEHYDFPSVLSGLRTIRAHAQHVKGEVLYTLHTGFYHSGLESGIESLVDCLLEFETVRSGADFERSIIIHKVANHPERTGVLKYVIGNAGITVVE
ncbi:MAG: recombinase RecA [Thermoplasmata archaeon]|nr:recombinase RecA [Thermoplasmata archaeon]